MTEIDKGNYECGAKSAWTIEACRVFRLLNGGGCLAQYFRDSDANVPDSLAENLLAQNISLKDAQLNVETLPMCQKV